MEQLLEYPLLLADLNELQFLTERYQLRNRLRVDATDDTSILSIVEQEVGVTVLPRSSLVNLSDKLRAVPLYPEIRRMLGVAYPSHPIKRVMDLIKFVKQRIQVMQRLLF
ncbi:hypothetical protein H6B51_14450 [Pseudoflavonifractor phocaeensis]|nr:hypothetical protein [Pseudoflavonifractor phocaeensis]